MNDVQQARVDVCIVYLNRDAVVLVIVCWWAGVHDRRVLLFLNLISDFSDRNMIVFVHYDFIVVFCIFFFLQTILIINFKFLYRFTAHRVERFLHCFSSCGEESLATCVTEY